MSRLVYINNCNFVSRIFCLFCTSCSCTSHAGFVELNELRLDFVELNNELRLDFVELNNELRLHILVSIMNPTVKFRINK